MEGCAINSTDRGGFAAAVDAARRSDATVVLVGLDKSIEDEGRDRTSIALPGQQLDLIREVAAGEHCPTLHDNRKDRLPSPTVRSQPLAMVCGVLHAAAKGPVVVVLIAGGAVDLSAAKDDDNVDAILFAGYPGHTHTHHTTAVLGGMHARGRLTG